MKKINSNLKKESTIFIFVGLTSVLIDISTYFLLIKLIKIITVSKFISFILGAIFSYFGNKIFTFKAKTKKLTPIYFSLNYCLSLLINIYSNNLILSFFGYKNNMILLIAFLISTSSSAIFNFVTMKFFVFKNK